MRPDSAALGVSSAIVDVLRRIGSVPIDYLAQSLGRDRAEIEPDLEELESKEVIERRDDTVRLKKTLKKKKLKTV